MIKKRYQRDKLISQEKLTTPWLKAKNEAKTNKSTKNDKEN